MPGRNRFYAAGVRGGLFEKAVAVGPCVFISHKREDVSIAREVGKALKALEVDIWLDVEDPATQSAADLADDKKLAEAIERGLINSTHLLALLSPITQGSWWVPYEIGAARGRTKELVFLVHQEVKNLPSYLVFGKRLLDQDDFFKWAEQISAQRVLPEMRANIQKSASANPLYGILPKCRTS